MMAVLRRASLLYLLLHTPNALGLQVTPNSPCALTCMDDPTQDVSDPKSSNTYPNDIVCADADYNSTAAGRKYESCVNCLRNSTFADAGENDQSWFIYNTRYTIASCLFGLTNVTDAESTPCSTETSCGPLQQSVENGNLSTDNESTYGYCSANNNAFLGSSLGGCISCLQDVTTETYLANFVTVLQAGCIEQPVTGINIGIRGNIFSSSPINITFPGDNPEASSSAHKKNRLSEGAIIGIVAGTVVFGVCVIAGSFICYRKFRHNRSMRQLRSPLDSRFGSKTISSPNSGAYSNPHVTPPKESPQSFDTSALSQKELKALGLQIPNFSKQHPNSTVPSEEDRTWQDSRAHFEATHNTTQNQLPAYSTIPAHQAYIPSAFGSVPSTDTNNTFRMSLIPPSRTSPSMRPPAAAPAPALAPAPAPAPPKPTIKSIPPPINIPQPRAQTAPQRVPQIAIPHSRNQSIPQQVQPVQVTAPRQQEETSQVARPTLHSQQAAVHHNIAYPAMLENLPLSRTNSIAGAWARARSTSRNGRNRSTSRNGGRNRSTSRNGFLDTVASMDVPVIISGPMIKHGGRFDSDFTEEGWREREQGKAGSRKRADATPSSAESEEQWPGAY